jgi:putative oxidoreductase
MGMKPGRFHATMAASTETFGGLALVAGLLTPLAAMAITGTMTVAGWVDHRKAFFIFKGGWEFVFTLAAIAVALAVTGPGEWSLDNAIGLDLDGWPALLIAGGGGLAAGAAFLAVFYRAPAQAAA